MAVVLEKRNGGPYTKKEQESRRSKVYNLHFEKGQSAVRIAEMINANRNTVNEDIKYWYSQIASDFESNNLPGLWALKQHNRLENQHGRLVSELEKQEKLKDKILLERMILDVDSKISELAQKIGITQIIEPETKSESQDTEKQIKEIVKKIISSPFPSRNLKKEKIIFKIIDATKCNKDKAENMIKEMVNLGLGLNRNTNDMIAETYDLVSFAELRGYLNDKELNTVYERLEEHERFIQVIKESKEKYDSKYGTDRSKWPKEIIEEIKNQITTRD